MAEGFRVWLMSGAGYVGKAGKAEQDLFTIQEVKAKVAEKAASDKKLLQGPVAGVTTMSSLEIAKLTGKRHDNVMRDITSMFADLETTALSFEESYTDPTGRILPCYKLDRHHTECLLTGYSAKMRMAVIKRWHELEDLQTGSSNGLVQSEAIIESLSGLQTEVKILKEMIRSIIAGPGFVREVVVKSPYEGTTKGTVSYHAEAKLS
ncbi:Rha family transcriptional regulator [Pseudomonas syringae]|uniref:Rha family transcriptional regulator n=1 Tax=Pseudomonas syringae TaxID=317 RepID=UPI001F0D789A|nr:Rha family transcriptional regulator [Pseudomonas syringae]MCH5668846.1 Rha family transcriptional regulator [Pseudomonas syringae pv. syringae]